MSSLSAEYTSPSTTEPVLFTHALPTLPASPTTADRTAYLSGLQSVTKALQTDVNAFLTQKMEEDKASGERGADANEEANYGEEVVDAD